MNGIWFDILLLHIYTNKYGYVNRYVWHNIYNKNNSNVYITFETLLKNSYITYRFFIYIYNIIYMHLFEIIGQNKINSMPDRYVLVQNIR